MSSSSLHAATEASGVNRRLRANGQRPARSRVLVVEDERDIADLIKHTLERAGDIDVEIAAGGDLALKAAAAHVPDLVLLDLNLPVISGLEVCRLLRSRSATKTVPIIMLTARSSENDRVVGLDVGADDYITKPFSTRELAARVRAALRRRRGEG
jgi:DNA-binding response OmpR family regulator